MLLTSIQIQGFKSFADKTVLKFGKGITAVVGPNGSGKSNISDAVRWVLGEQSTKSLRGQSMEDVIFGGTAERRPHGYCEVTLNIDNTDRTLNFDNDSVAVTRRYYRSHESEYLINGSVVRLKDVHELFMDTGLGRDGYSMIGQGKIDSIISSKSQERRDIFEEASGISRYRYKKTDAERKLAAAEDNLLRLLDIMKELESRIGPLKEQSAKAEKFLLLAENKKQLEIGLWLDIIENSKNLIKEQENKISIAQLHYKEIENKLLEFDMENEKNSADFARFSAEIDDKRQRISDYNENIAKLYGDISVLNNDIMHNNQTIERLKNEIYEINGSTDKTKEEIEEKRKLINEKTIEAESLSFALAQTEKQLSEILLSSEDISRKIENDVLELNNLSIKSADAKVTLMSSQSSIQEINSRHDVIVNLIDEKCLEIEKLSVELNETKALISRIEEDEFSYNNSIKGYKLRYDSRKEKTDELKLELENIRLDIEAKKHKVEILKDLEKNMDGFNHSVKTIMNESSSGNLKGVFGPITRLITVEKKYSIAIETALGTAAQNIIVDTDSTAKRAVEMLKKTNSGRATFWPVSSTKSREFKENGFDDEFGYIGVASDLVKCDNKFTEIIKCLLGGTIVCDDIDSAIAIAKKYNYRIKIVSLDGQVINPGGSITGGSLIKNAGLLSRSGDIEKINSDIQKLIDKSKETESAYNAANAELSKVSGEIITIEDLLKALNEDKIRALGELKRISDLLETSQKQADNLRLEMDDADSKINSLNAIIADSTLKLKEYDEVKSQIEEKIAEMSGGRDSISQKREALSAEITEEKLKIIEITKDIENLTVSTNVLEYNENNRLERISSINEEVKRLEENNISVKDNIHSIEETITFLKTACETFDAEIADLINRRNDNEASGTQLRIEEKEITLEREKVNGELARLSERRDALVKENSDVIRQLFEEYQLTKTEAEEIGIKIENASEAKKNLNEIKSKIRALGNVNVSAIEEYKEVSERYVFMKEQIDDVEKSRTELHKLIDQLTAQMKELFVVGFNKIGENFSKTFYDLFGGGTAKLVLTEPDNILESGIDIVAKLPGKNVPSLDGLSGGEKALIALAIYFAIMRVNAPPFCFLDEVDTALDDINVDRFADYMGKSDFKTQFICITHRRGTMEAADMLYGVTMQEKGISKLLALNMVELEKQLKLENGR